MTINGHVENGQIILDDAALLQDGMKVRVELLATGSGEPVTEEQVPTLNERYKSIIGIAKNLPPDFARNHDHYIHGLPKR